MNKLTKLASAFAQANGTTLDKVEVAEFSDKLVFVAGDKIKVLKKKATDEKENKSEENSDDSEAETCYICGEAGDDMRNGECGACRSGF